MHINLFRFFKPISCLTCLGFAFGFAYLYFLLSDWLNLLRFYYRSHCELRRSSAFNYNFAHSLIIIY